jgi:predicted ester cyclase
MWEMSETNKRLALRWLDAIWNGDLDAPAADGVVEQLIHQGFYNHEVAADRPGGPEGFRDTARRLRGAFADLRIEPLDVVAEADKVVIRARVSGRQVGAFAGMPVTGREFSVEHTHIVRILDGKVVEHWASRDDCGMMRQLGLLRIGGDSKAA